MKITKTQILIFWITILYIIAFAFYYILNGNYEFLFYIAIMIALLIFLTKFHFKYNFPTWILAGASGWGLMHMLGGSLNIAGDRLYALILIPLFEAGTPVLRFDQFAHFYFYFFATLILFYIFKDKFKQSQISFYLLIFLSAIGIGSLNEIAEFLTVLIFPQGGVGDYFNNAWDLVFNTIGSISALIYLKINEK